jgi:hypothetical protein
MVSCDFFALSIILGFKRKGDYYRCGGLYCWANYIQSNVLLTHNISTSLEV